MKGRSLAPQTLNPFPLPADSSPMLGKLFPEIQTEEDAKKASKQAAGFCFFIAVVTGVVAYLQMNKIIDLFPGVGGYAFIDAGLFVVIGIFLLRYSRIAAVAGLLLYAAEQVFTIMQSGYRFNLIVIFATLALINAVRGTFAYHDMKSGASTGAMSEASARRMEFAAKLIFRLVILGGLGFAAYMTYNKFSGKDQPQSRVFTRPTSSMPKISLPEMPKFKMPDFSKKTAAPAEGGAAAPAQPAVQEGSRRTFKMKDGRTVSGKVIYEDETYYTLETPSGDEIVIKADLA